MPKTNLGSNPNPSTSAVVFARAGLRTHWWAHHGHLVASPLQFDWNLDRKEVSVFVRAASQQQHAPAFVCKPREWLANLARADRSRMRTEIFAMLGGAARSFDLRFCVLAADGSEREVACSGLILRDECGKPQRVVAQQTPLVADSEHPAELPSPFHDPLTGLPNRRMFDRSLSAALAGQQLGARPALLFVDLDRFKLVNDRHGHLIGDKVLVAVAQRLAHCVRPEDVLARRDGDEFTVLARDIEHARHAAAIAERMLEQLRPSLALDGHELRVTASIGIALATEPWLDAERLLTAADAAMYAAKSQGGDGYQVADEEIASRCARPVARQAAG